MNIETWVTFALASTLILVIPGPTVIMVASYTLLNGKNALKAALGGVILGDFIAMVLALIGVGTLLSLSSQLFIIIKWVGAFYLVFLGIKLLRSTPIKLEISTSKKTAKNKKSQKKIFNDCFFATVLNPKSIVFFTSFLPQFISTEHSLIGQFSIMTLTFIVLSTLNVFFVVFSLNYIKSQFENNFFLKNLHRIGGGLLVSTGLFAMRA